jgi:Spy/CpxP family protein refolding chaperone
MADEINENRRRFTRTRETAVALLLTMAAAGAEACGGGAASTPPSSAATSANASTAEDDDIAAGVHEFHRHHHHGGVTLLIALSLDTLGVSAEQRAAVEKIRTDLHAKMEPARAAEQNLHTLLAEGIAAGAIDQAKVDAAVAQIAAAGGPVYDATVDSLNQLHAVLTPPERAALAQKVEAHWGVWQKANEDEQKDATGQPAQGGQLARLAREIGLTQEQIDKVHAALASNPSAAPHADPQEIAAHVHAFAEAFRADTFDARSISTGSADDAHLASAGAARMARFYEAVAAPLTADQRTKLANILREHASYNPSAKGA